MATPMFSGERQKPWIRQILSCFASSQSNKYIPIKVDMMDIHISNDATKVEANRIGSKDEEAENGIRYLEQAWKPSLGFFPSSVECGNAKAKAMMVQGFGIERDEAGNYRQRLERDNVEAYSDLSTQQRGDVMDGKFSLESSKPMTVYVWDMDETLILLKSLLDGTYAEAFNGSKDKRKGIEIGKQWENHILQVCDEHFFYEEIEDYNEPYLDALNEYDDGRDLSKYNFHNDGFGFPYDDWNKRKMAYRHRAIQEKYSQGLYKILDQQTVKNWNDMYDLTDSYTDGWLSSGAAGVGGVMVSVEQVKWGAGWNQILGHVLTYVKSNISTNLLLSFLSHALLKQTLKRTKCQNINVLVTSGSLIPSLAKCLLYQLDDVIPANNVYSSWEVGKLRCFSWIKERFASENVRFCVIGDGNEECEAAQTMGWPFIRIDHRPISPYRFPGLTMKSVLSYIDVAYQSSDANVEETIE
ncbi:hypothetical protein ZIOFF_061725 [Zingiber officinale]|uniref:protein-tyrosine-phosphatase n=1 Tax=Zingiber officinale TaxID=94328 RepID=A0A8J5F0J9_ZINOF|nr:hypothetical protein ZIOFF_061725 [Zingiber officinale]